MKNGIIGFVILTLVLAVVGLLLPRHVTVTRSIIIDAPASEIFPLVNSMKRTEEWSPWLSIDPDVALTYEGPSEGVGSVLSWTSEHPNVGSGRQEITESTANSRVLTALDFGEMGTATASFDLAPQGGGTQVTWGLVADMGGSPVGRWMGLMMDRLVGGDYERGLANLKKVVEASFKPTLTICFHFEWMESIKLKLNSDMLEVCHGLARRDDVSVGHFIRQAIAHEISRNRNARPPNRADEQLIAPLRARLASDLAYARDWDELQNRLQAKGYTLVAAGGGLALHRWPSNERLCKASELGFSYAKLVNRFQKGFPGHTHTWIEARVLSQSDTAQEDFDLIEPF